MINFNLFDNLLDFIYELIELLKEDWNKFKLFVKENKKNLIWLFIALITLQFTNLINIGNSCNKYYKTQNEQIQTGGSSTPPPLPPRRPSTPPPVPPRRPSTPPPIPPKPGATPPPIPPKPGATPPTTGTDADGKKKDKGAGADAEADADKKSIKKGLDLFNKAKGKKDKLAKNGMAGPIFGNLEGIFGAVGGIFSLVITILTILGILSLPVLIFIIITYCVVKMLLGHLALI
jgi:hypothetical protein